MKACNLGPAAGQTAKSIVKLLLQSRRVGIHRAPHDKPLIIMANGPSLNDTIAAHADTLRRADTMSVNFAPLAPVYAELRPAYHVLADPLFFGVEQHDNVPRLYDALSRVDWPLTLLVPHKYRHALPAAVTDNPNIGIETFNFVGVEGFAWFERFAYSHRTAMPRPRNVLIVAIMCGIWLGYENICLTGADHSWMQTISVDDNNNVISVQPHFYSEKADEQRRVDTLYRGYRLHRIIYSFYVAFSGYHRIRRFADSRGVNIINATPHSFIDAFDRAPLPDALIVHAENQ